MPVVRPNKSPKPGRVRFTQKHFFSIETCTMAEALFGDFCFAAKLCNLMDSSLVLSAEIDRMERTRRNVWECGQLQGGGISEWEQKRGRGRGDVISQR